MHPPRYGGATVGELAAKYDQATPAEVLVEAERSENGESSLVGELEDIRRGFEEERRGSRQLTKC
jgi:hypothetical protein